LKIGVRAHDFGGVSHTELVKLFLEKGVETTQLALQKAFADFPPAMSNEAIEFVKNVKKSFEQSNISIAVLGCYINPVSDNHATLLSDIAKFKDNIEYARLLNAKLIGTETGSLNKDFSYNKYNHSKESYRKLISVLEPLLELAQIKGVNIGIEAVCEFIIHSPKTTQKLLKDLASSNLKIILDPVNILNKKNFKNQLDVFEKAFFHYGDKIEVIHFKDFVMAKTKMEVPFGNGQFDWKGFLSIAKKYKSDCEIILESSAPTTFERTKDQILQYLNTI
jgi:L-ribulose-5-phosphate 3-epimerase